MEILVSELSIPEKSVKEKGHTRRRERERGTCAHVSLVHTEVYAGPSCTFICTCIIGQSSQGVLKAKNDGDDEDFQLAYLSLAYHLL